MGNHIEIVPLTRNPRQVLRFLRASYPIYRDNPSWVAPLLCDLKKVFSDENPLFDHADMAIWVATCGGRDAGRIAGIFDEAYNQAQQDKVAFFGFFECSNDPAVSHQLFEAVFAWARQRGARFVLGPMNPTTNDECGLLVDSFDSLPFFMTPYNPPYYQDLVLAEGFCKAKDLLAFHLDFAHCPIERLARIAEQVRKRHPELKFTAIRKSTLQRDLTKIKAVYNAAWKDNWGFVPMTDAEIDFMANRLKPLLLEGAVWVAESPAGPIGFMLGLPDYNPALQPLQGRLFTPGIFGFLPYFLGWKCPSRCRVLTLGVNEEFRNRGLEAVMLTESFKTAFKAGIKEAEASWILEDNTMMCRLLESFGGKVSKTYRLYQRKL